MLTIATASLDTRKASSWQGFQQMSLRSGVIQGEVSA